MAKTNAELVEENKVLNEKNITLETENVTLNEKVAELESTNVTLNEKVAELESTNVTLNEKVTELESTNEDLEEKVQIKPSKAYESKKGASYRFVNGERSFSVLGYGRVSPKLALKNADIMEKLIKIGYSGLELVTTKKTK